MGTLLSRFHTADEGDYKRILAELDDKIRVEEVRLSEIRVREKRSRIIWLVYASLFYVVYTVGWYLFGWRTSDAQEHWTLYGLKAAPVFVMPAIIFAVNNMMGWWYRRKQTNEESQLGHLRAQQKHKLEELKKKTDYYTIKTLLEQYDPQSRGSGQEMRQRGPQPSAALQSNGAPANGDAIRPIIVTNKNRPQTVTPATPTKLLSGVPMHRTWYDRLLDAIVGDDGPSTKYALICASCHAHNGLIPQHELDDVAYVCPKCGSFNPSRKAIREGIAFQPPSSDEHVAPTTTTATTATVGKRTVTPPRGRSTTPRPTTTSTSRDRDGLTHFDQMQPYDVDDYDDDGVAVSKRLASRSNSRKRHRSRSQNGISVHRGSTGDARRRYDTDTEDEGVSRPS